MSRPVGKCLRSGGTAGALAGLCHAGFFSLLFFYHPAIICTGSPSIVALFLYWVSVFVPVFLLLGILLSGPFLLPFRRVLRRDQAGPLVGIALLAAVPLFFIASWLNVKHLPDLGSPVSLFVNSLLLLGTLSAGAGVLFILRKRNLPFPRPPGWIFLLAVFVFAGSVAFFLSDRMAGSSTDSPTEEAQRRAEGFRGGGSAPGLPNVLLITVDTLRADHVGAYGYGRDTTPHIDRLAEEGALFRSCLSPAPNTHPSIASLLTSLPVSAFDNYSLAGFLPGSAPDLAAILKTHGYRTGAVVDNPWLSPALGFSRGFDEYREVSSRKGGAGLVVDAALEWLAESPQEPFFLWVHFLDPHHPYEPPAPFEKAFLPPWAAGLPGGGPRTVTAYLKRLASRRGQESRRELERVIALYDGEILYTDAEIGRLTGALRDRQLLDRALLVLTADHGEEFLEHGGMLHGHSLYNELLLVPLIVRLPGSIPAGQAIDGEVSTLDVLPTVLQFCRIGIPEACRGGGLHALLRREAPASGLNRPVPHVSEKLHRDKFGAGPALSLKLGSWKLIEPYYRPYLFGYSPSKIVESFKELGVFLFETDPLQLYDISRDPAEKRNLVGSGERERIADLRKVLRESACSAPRLAPSGGVPSGLDKETWERIRSLGYVR
jgi:arylsulfatase A-like enzyme